MGYGIMIEGFLAAKGEDPRALNNSLSLIKSWLAMVNGGVSKVRRVWGVASLEDIDRGGGRPWLPQARSFAWRRGPEEDPASVMARMPMTGLEAIRAVSSSPTPEVQRLLHGQPAKASLCRASPSLEGRCLSSIPNDPRSGPRAWRHGRPPPR